MNYVKINCTSYLPIRNIPFINTSCKESKCTGHKFFLEAVPEKRKDEFQAVSSCLGCESSWGS